MLTIVGTVLNCISLNSCFWYSMVTAGLLSKARDEPKNGSWECNRGLHETPSSSVKPRIHAKVSG